MTHETVVIYPESMTFYKNTGLDSPKKRKEKKEKETCLIRIIINIRKIIFILQR